MTTARWPGTRLSVSGLMMLVVFPTLCCVDWEAPRRAAANQHHQRVRPTPAPTPEIGAPDPLALLKRAVQLYDRNVRSYTCTFHRTERVEGRLTREQIIEVAYRNDPHSVAMQWVRNAENVRRLAYRKGLNRAPDGDECALVEPNGTVARLVASRVPVPIHGPLARRSSRYTLDEFGFRATLDRVLRVNAMAGELGDLDLKYAGTSQVDGRPTMVIERRLPYTGENGLYPEALLVLHLDKQWLVPVAIYTYADTDGEVLLGRYLTTNIRINPPLGSDAFDL